MVKLENNLYALRPAKQIAKPPASVDQENVREFVLELEDGEQDLPVPEDEDRFGNAVGARRLGIVLSHGCELDKTPQYPIVTMAQVRPLAPLPREVQGGVRDYSQKRTLYLPAGKVLTTEHFADFRQLTTVRRDVVDDLPKVASMNEDGQRLLQFQLFRFFLRKRLPDGWESWPDEAEDDE